MTEKEEILKLKKQVEISKTYFKNILDVDPNIMPKSIGHLSNCVRVMKISAEKALEVIDESWEEVEWLKNKIQSARHGCTW